MRAPHPTSLTRPMPPARKIIKLPLSFGMLIYRRQTERHPRCSRTQCLSRLEHLIPVSQERRPRHTNTNGCVLSPPTSHIKGLSNVTGALLRAVACRHVLLSFQEHIGSTASEILKPIARAIFKRRSHCLDWRAKLPNRDRDVAHACETPSLFSLPNGSRR